MSRSARITRRAFARRASGMLLAQFSPRVAQATRVEVVDPAIRLSIETDGPARIRISDSQGRMFQPEGAVMDRTAHRFRDDDRYYLGHFTSTGTAALKLPAGRYTLVAEKGLEFQRLESSIDLDSDRTIHLAPQRWTHMAEKGWISADFHVHRPIEDAKLLITAEDLNLGVFFTMWNNVNLWQGKQLPSDPVMRADSQHLATVMNAEDERGGGAWMMHNIKQPLALGQADRWYPQGHVFVDQAKAQGAWFEVEKPIWWEVPVMTAITSVDSLGVVHNHFNEYGVVANEAWGRPRNQELYPGIQGFWRYSLDLYYRFLNLGKRYPASGGSASGVLPSPPGYSRMYVYAPGSTSVPSFYSALRAGHSFATNGPMLTFTADGHIPGDTVQVAPGRPLQISAEAEAREPIDRIEIIANGRIVSSTPGSRLQTEFEPKNHNWLAARCVLKTASTIRFAHTSPIYLNGERQRWDDTDDKAYFLKWIDDLISQTEADPKRFAGAEQKNEVLGVYRAARDKYSK